MIDASQLIDYPWSSARCYLTGVSDELIKPQEHPYHQKFEQNSESFTKAYAEYLNIAHEEDLELFRSEKSHIGDEKFISSIISTIGHLSKLALEPKPN